MATKKFRDPITDEIIEVEREIRTLRFKTTLRGGYYNGKEHNIHYFTDKEGTSYQYESPVDSEGFELTAIGKAIDYRDNDDLTLAISGYFLKNGPSDYRIYNPRLIHRQQGQNE